MESVLKMDMVAVLDKAVASYVGSHGPGGQERVFSELNGGEVTT